MGASSMNETNVTIVGNVISDPRQRRTSEGTKVVSFRMSSHERRYDKAAEQWVDGDHLYVTVTCWRRLAAGVAASLVKGDPVMVRGRLYTREYEVEGQRRYSTEVEAASVGPDLARCTADVQRPRREQWEPHSEGAQVRAESRVPRGDGVEPDGDVVASGATVAEADTVVAGDFQTAEVLAAAAV
jgi:single-strand DNA-binding protein